MELIVSVAVPVFFNVTSCALEVVPTIDAGKAIDAGVSETAGAEDAVPVPVRVTVFGDPLALSAIESDALNAPAAAGLNSTETVQVAAAASVVPQVVADLMNEVAFVPVMVSEARFSVAVPEFLMVTVCAAVVEPTVVAAKLSEVGVSVTAGAVPVPVRATDCGDPVALSAIESDALNAPAAAGLNSTETVQVAAAASVVPQVVADLMNEVALVPVMVSEVRFSVAVPEFLMVTVCAAVVEPTVVAAKLSEVGVSVTAGAVPVPVRATDCGDPVALSAIESDAPNAPAAAGLNSTETVQVAAAASVVPQVVADLMNEVALVPVMVSEVRFSVAVPEFLMVTVCAAVVEPTVVAAKLSEVGVSMTAGAVPVPVRATDCGDPVALSAIESDALNAPAAAGLNSTETVQV